MSSQGGTLTFLYIRRLGLFFGVQNLNFNIFFFFFFGGGSKKLIFSGV